MIRVYFIFEDPLDDAQVNLSFVDVPTRDPRKAFERVEQAAESGELWKQMYELCDKALIVLKAQKERFPHCGTPDLYDLALDFKLASDRRYRENLEDSECPQTTIPKGLFPKTS